MKDKIRVAIVVSHPIQHFVFLYKALAKQENIELKVFFASKIGVKPYFDKDMAVEIQWATDLLAGYQHEFLPDAENIKSTGFREINNPGVIRALRFFSPDVVQLHGYAQLTLLRALLWCSLKRIPVLLWSDSSLLFQRPSWKSKIKKWVLPVLLRLFDGFLSTGNNNADYYRYYGVKPESIFYCPFTVDRDRLEQARKNIPELRLDLRQRYEIDPREIVLLFVGKLAPWKRPGDLLKALVSAQEYFGGSVKLVAFFAGDGVLRKDLETQAQAEKIRAIFAGFINVDILPSVYAMADILVFPSDKEPYGLSAREAICVGLPLIVSDQIGCVGYTDAARPDCNAIVYPSSDVDALASAIVDLCKNKQRYKEYSEASLKVAVDMGVDKSVEGFMNAIQSVLN